jgi:Skp family chaperone for outer membrane proteins
LWGGGEGSDGLGRRGMIHRFDAVCFYDYAFRYIVMRRSIMDTASTIVALLRELGTPAITVIGFGWVLFQLKKLGTKVSSDMTKLETRVSSDMEKLETKVSSDMTKLEAKVSSDIAELKVDMEKLETKVSSDIAELKVDMSELRADVKSIKSNHLPHIEAAIKLLAKGTPNEEPIKTILDLSYEPDSEQQ